jgi:putative flippase GtrA
MMENSLESVAVAGADEAPPARPPSYVVYLVVGVGVTVVTVLLRTLIGLVVPDDTPAGYQGTIVLAYLAGMVMSLVAHKELTFRWGGRMSAGQVAKFFGIHLLGMFLNLSASARLCAALLPLMGDETAKALAFGVAAFAISVISFVLKKALVFVSG